VLKFRILAKIVDTVAYFCKCSKYFNKSYYFYEW